MKILHGKALKKHNEGVFPRKVWRFREIAVPLHPQNPIAAMVELVDTRDLKSLDPEGLCGFESRSRHTVFPPYYYDEQHRMG